MVAVEVPKLNSQSPVPGRIHRFSRIIEKGPRDIGQQREAAASIISVQAIGFRQLQHLAVRPNPEAPQPARMGRRLPIHLGNLGKPPFVGHTDLNGRIRQGDQVAVVGAV